MISKCITYLFDDYRKQRNALLFKNLLYIFILLKCFFWILNFDLLFGEHALSQINEYQVSFIKRFAFMLYYSTSPVYPVICIIFLIGVSMFSLIKVRSHVILDALVYMIIININAKLYTATTAGDPLLANLCFLSIFLRKNFTVSNSFIGQLSILLHNFSFFALVTQVCILYSYSALAKWYDADWQNGTAIHVVNSTYHYSRAFLIDHASMLFPVSFVMSYLVLIYQSVFVFMIWLKKPKRYFLHFGVLMHLYIAFVIGLFFFGLIMAITYALFYDLEEDS